MPPTVAIPKFFWGDYVGDSKEEVADFAISEAKEMNSEAGITSLCEVALTILQKCGRSFQPSADGLPEDI